MKKLLNERVPFTILVVPIVLVVMVLAMQMYRWSNQISRATSVRLADILQMSMVNWHLNLFRDLSDICLAMRVDFDDRGDIERYVRRFSEWKAGAPYPDVVERLYILLSSGPNPAAFQLDPPAERFEATEWPQTFAYLRTEPLRLAVQEAGENEELNNTLYAPGLAGWLFDPSIPALVRPIDFSPPDPSGGADWIAIELNAAVIQTEILPDLAHRYFMGVDGLDYMVAVVARTPDAEREVVYSSDSGFASEEVADPDGLMDVFGSQTRRMLGTPIFVFHELSESARLSELAKSIGTSWFPLTGESSADHDWQLIVRHRRGGALGAFVAQMHRRDLAISFGILSLLVMSVAMLIVTSQRAHRLAKLQMGFVTAVSHELRTPLTIIRSAAENISQDVVDNKQQLAQYGAVIESQSRQLSSLVEDILLFAATREDRHRYNLRPLEISEIVDATLASTAGLIEASRFTLERDIPPRLPQVVGDLFALSQCLQNLITNALKYGGAERWIGIRASVHENTDGGGREIRIAVADRGMGIEAEDLPHIFEPFYRSPSAAAQIHGTGLGLSVAKSVAEAMNGRLTVESAPQRGSTFTLHLKCIESPDAKSPAN